MAHYPDTLVENVQFLLPGTGLGERADEALLALHAKGFVAGAGQSRLHVPETFKMAQEPGIVEYCPNDAGRFNSDKVQQWIAKDGGRGFVGIYDVRQNDGASLEPADVVKLEDEQIVQVAYGWSGNLGKDITTAYRVGEAGSNLARARRAEGERFGLGKQLGELVVASAVVLYGADPEEITLEVWKSNHARSLYNRIGFSPFGEEVEADRPTLRPIGTMIGKHTVYYDQEKGKNMVTDYRLDYALTDHPLLVASKSDLQPAYA